MNLFKSTSRSIIDSGIWCFIFLIGVKFWRFFARRMHIFVCILVLFMLTSFIDAYRISDKRLDFTKFQGENGLYFVDKQAFFSKVCFSKTNNTIVFLVDSLDTFAFEKTLEIYPELQSIFSGFWYFRNNLGTGGMTLEAIPQILSGQIYNPKTDFYDFVHKAEVGKESMASIAFTKGRRVFVETDNSYIIDATSIDKESTSSNKMNNIEKKDIYALYFRFIPYFFSKYFEDKVNIKNYDIHSYLINGYDRNKNQFNNIISRINILNEKPVFLFLYFFGMHLPFIKDDMLYTTKEFFEHIEKFVDLLKRLDLYDKTTFIIMSDHGHVDEEHDHRYYYPNRQSSYSTYFFPVLMIKPDNSNGELVIRDDLMSSCFLKEILNDFYTNGSSNAILQNRLVSLPKTRYIYVRGGLFKSDFLHDAVYEVHGYMNDLQFKEVKQD